MKKFLSTISIMIVCMLLVFSLAACSASITGIEIKKDTLATSIEEGETYDTSDAVVLVNYSDSTQQEVSASDDSGITFSDLDTSVVGDQILTVSYMGFSVSMTVTVTARALTDAEKLSSISLDEGTVANKVAVGDTLDTSGAVVRATMADGTSSIVDNSKLVFSSISTSAVGEQTLTITYTDSNDTTVTAKHTVTVVADGTGLEDISTLTVKSGTLSTTVQYDSVLTMPTLVATYGNGIITEITTDITVNGLDTSILGEQSITFSYDGVTTDATTVTVSADADQQAKIATSIVLTTSPANKINRLATLDLSGVVASVTFMNGLATSYTYSDLSFGDFDNTVVGAQTLTVSFTDSYGNVVSVEHTVTVNALSSETAETLTVASGTLANKVVENGTLDTADALFTVEFADGTTTTVTEIAVSLDTTATGSATAVLSYTDIYGNKVTLDWAVTVVDDTVDLTATESLAIKSGTIASVAEYQEEFDTSTIVVIATLVDGTTVTLSASDLTLSTVDTDTLGATTLDITYDGVTIQHAIEVALDTADMALYAVSIELTTSPASKLVRLSTLDLSGVVASVTFKDGKSTSFGYSDLSFSDFDNSVVGAQTLTISYTDTFGNEVSVDHTVTVSARDSETPDELTVSTGTLATSVNQNGTLSLTDASFTIEFVDGSTATPTADQLSVTLSTATTGSATATITFTNDYGTATLSWAVTVVDASTDLTDVDKLSVKSGTLANSINYNGTLDTSNLVLVVTYKSGIVAEVAMSSAVTVVVNDNKAYTTGTTATITYDGVSCEHALTVNTTGINIPLTLTVTGLPSTISVGGSWDTSSVVATVGYYGGATATVTVTIPTADTTAAGTGKTVTISYTENGTTVSYTHTYTVKESTVAVSQLESQLLTTYTENVNATGDEGFVDTASTALYAGNDNAYHLSLIATDSNLANISSLARVAKTITVEYKSGNSWVTTDIAGYVTVDSDYAMFYFTEDAIGMTFRITITATETTVTVSDIVAEVTVVDGWNVYDSADLSILDNTDMSFSVGLASGSYTDSWKNWKQENAAEVYDYQYVQGNDVVGIVLQADIVLTSEDFPEEYFWKSTEYGFSQLDALTGGAGDYGDDIQLEGSLKDAANNWGVYQREVDNGEVFTVEGNFFSITATDDIRVVAEVDALSTGSVANSETNYILGHHTGLLHFSVDDEAITDASTSVLVTNVCFAGNAANDGLSASSGGIIMLYADGVNFTADNIISNYFYKSYFFVDYYSTVDSELTGNFLIQNAKGYGNYEMYVYGWAAQRVTIIDSEFVGCGGPVMVFDEIIKRDSSDAITARYPAQVNVINSTLSTGSSYQTGEEPWYEGSGMNVVAAYLKSLNSVLFGGASQSVITTINNKEVFNCLAVIQITDGYKSGDLVSGYVRMFDSMSDYTAYYAESATVVTKANITVGLDGAAAAADMYMSAILAGGSVLAQGSGGYGNYVYYTGTGADYGSELIYAYAGLTVDSAYASAGNYCNIYNGSRALVAEFFPTSNND